MTVELVVCWRQQQCGLEFQFYDGCRSFFSAPSVVENNQAPGSAARTESEFVILSLPPAARWLYCVVIVIFYVIVSFWIKAEIWQRKQADKYWLSVWNPWKFVEVTCEENKRIAEVWRVLETTKELADQRKQSKYSNKSSSRFYFHRLKCDCQVLQSGSTNMLDFVWFNILKS